MSLTITNAWQTQYLKQKHAANPSIGSYQNNFLICWSADPYPNRQTLLLLIVIGDRLQKS